jgi:hypothetical protein
MAMSVNAGKRTLHAPARVVLRVVETVGQYIKEFVDSFNLPNVGKKGHKMLIPKSQLGYFLLHNSTQENSTGVAVDMWTPEGGAYTTLTLQVGNSATATVTLEATLDEVAGDWYPVLAENLSTSGLSSSLTTGLWRVVVVGLRKIRVNMTDYADGRLIVRAVAVA